MKHFLSLTTLGVCRRSIICISHSVPVNLGLKLQLNDLCTRKLPPIMSHKVGPFFLFTTFRIFRMFYVYPIICPIVNTCSQISSLNIKLILKYLCLSL